MAHFVQFHYHFYGLVFVWDVVRQNHIILQTLARCADLGLRTCQEENLFAEASSGAFEQMAVRDMETIIVVCGDKQPVVVGESYGKSCGVWAIVVFGCCGSGSR